MLMQLLLLFAFSTVVAIIFNWGTPKFAATSIGKRFVGSYMRVTLGTAVVFFLAVYVSALLLSAIGERAKLPGA